MKKIIAVLILSLLLSSCGKREKSLEQKEIKASVPMIIFWGVQLGIPNAMSPSLIENLKLNNIDATIHTDETVKNLDFSSVVNDQVLILSDFIASIILRDNLDWRVVGRLNDFRVGIMVPNQSSVNQFADLRDKRVCGNVFFVKMIKTHSEKIGMVPETFLKFFPTDDEKIRQAVINSKNGEWEDCDAILVPDSLLSYFEVKKLGRIIDQDIVVNMIMAKNSYIQNNPEVMVDFFRAFSTSLNIFRKNMISEKKFSVEGMPEDIAPQVYRLTYENEENFDEQALKPLRFYLNKDEIDSFQNNADMIFDYVPAKPRINVIDYIDTSYAEKALERKTQ